MLETPQERIKLLKAGIPANLIEDLYILYNSESTDKPDCTLNCFLVEMDLPAIEMEDESPGRLKY